MKLKHGKRIRGIDRCFKCGRRRAEILLDKVYFCRECVYLSLKHEKLDNFFSKNLNEMQPMPERYKHR